jgi:hypothetical protein
MHRLIVISSLACLTALNACHHPARTVTFSGGCTGPGSPIGPPSHLQFIRSSVADSIPFDHERGRLVAIFQWSSDSLARKSPALTVRFELRSLTVRLDSSGYAGAVDYGGLVRGDTAISKTTHLVREGSYRFLVYALGAAPLDTALSIRAGFSDTARIFLQASGVQICR